VVTFAAASPPTVASSKGRAPNLLTATSTSLPFGDVPAPTAVRRRQRRGVPRFAAGDVAVIGGPAEIPDGFLATYRDPGGATISVMDQTGSVTP
jgi:hypothetical protein